MTKSIQPITMLRMIISFNDETRKIFEPYAPPIEERLKAIAKLHQNGIRTYVRRNHYDYQCKN
jgi:DNA repair photolyase